MRWILKQSWKLLNLFWWVKAMKKYVDITSWSFLSTFSSVWSCYIKITTTCCQLTITWMWKQHKVMTFETKCTIHLTISLCTRWWKIKPVKCRKDTVFVCFQDEIVNVCTKSQTLIFNIFRNTNSHERGIFHHTDLNDFLLDSVWQGI